MNRPKCSLTGRQVVVTRAADQAPLLVARLEALGAEVIVLPVIEIADAADGGMALAGAAAAVATFDWVVLTSVNAVDRFLPLVGGRLEPAVAVVGPSTADALKAHGRRADLVPERAVGEALVEAFPPGPGRVLLPQAAGARQVVAEGLRAKGWEVDVVEAYRTVRAVPPPEALSAARTADAITFASSSAVTGYVGVAVGQVRVPPVVVCIGPVTAATARRSGITVTAVAEPHTIEGLVDAVISNLVVG